MKKLPIPQVGTRYGRLSFLEQSIRKTPRAINTMWTMRCDCGNTITAARSDIKAGKTKSCRCLSSEVTARNNYRHGHAVRGKKDPVYQAWCAMVTRCTNKNQASWNNYGGRGISMCQRWNDFKNFFEDMGGTFQKGLSLERVNNEKGYSPENCKWATRKEQNSNQRRCKGYADRIKRLSHTNVDN